MAQRGLLPGAASSLTLGSRASTPTPSLEDSTEGAKFRKTVTWKVRNSLRAWGDLRLAELVMGELPPSVQGGDEGDAGGGADLAASTRPPSRPASASRGRSASGLLRVSSAP